MPRIKWCSIVSFLFLSLCLSFLYIRLSQPSEYTPTKPKHHKTDKYQHLLVNTETVHTYSKICPGLVDEIDLVPYNMEIMASYFAFSAANSTKSAVTLTTHATLEYLEELRPLTQYWEADISVAVFTPGEDFCFAVEQIQNLRRCVRRVKDRVSVHLYFPLSNPPVWNKNNSLRGEYDCNSGYLLQVKSSRRVNGLSYPVNVGRNIARQSAKTKYILASDIELYPSAHLAAAFANFIHSQDRVPRKHQTSRLVYVLPIFEVERNSPIPRTKFELLDLYRAKKANYFHRFVCAHCQKFPGLDKWLRTSSSLDDKISSLVVVGRHFPYHRWEPIFIGTAVEPPYDEKLSWDGYQDKMAHMHRLCLLGYSFAVLDNAFLVHKPGVKRRKTSVDEEKTEFIRRNNEAYVEIMEDLEEQFGTNYKCKSGVKRKILESHGK